MAILLVAGLLTLYVASCNSGDNPATGDSSTSAPKVVATYPADGSSGVPVNTPISLVFSQPMDTASVRTGFHFAGGQPMMIWMDSLGHYAGMGHMGGGMGGMDHDDIQRMLDWMDSIQVPGAFEWGFDLDSCRFIPDSTLAGGTSYLMFLYGNVMGEAGGMMRMAGLADDSLRYSFTTSP